MTDRLVDGARTHLTPNEAAFVGWMNSEYLNMHFGQNCAIPGRTVVSVNHLRGRFNVWLHKMQDKGQLKDIKFFDEVRVLDLLGDCGFIVTDGRSGKRCFWPPKDTVAAMIYGCTKGRLGKKGELPKSHEKEWDSPSGS